MTEEALEQGQVKMYMTDDMEDSFPFEATHIRTAASPVTNGKAWSNGCTKISHFEPSIDYCDRLSMKWNRSSRRGSGVASDEVDPLERMIPGIFAGIILFSIVMTGMMIFQSASQEKKEKVAEIILSSLTPTELMQGKIIGYFVLGITQVIVWLVVALPAVMWRFDIPLIEVLTRSGITSSLIYRIRRLSAICSHFRRYWGNS